MNGLFTSINVRKALTGLVLGFGLTSCISDGDYFSSEAEEVASCFTAKGDAQFAGQSSASTSGCKCQITRKAGISVTEAVVSSDGNECYMKIIKDESDGEERQDGN